MEAATQCRFAPKDNQLSYCRDVTGDGKFDKRDFKCVRSCVFPLSPSSKDLDPDLINHEMALVLIEQDDPIHDQEGLFVNGFNALRANTNGVAVIGVRYRGPSEPRRLLMVYNENGLRTVMREGQDYGQGVIEEIQFGNISNVNANGQFAVSAVIRGIRMIYRIDGVPIPEAAVHGHWTFY